VGGVFVRDQVQLHVRVSRGDLPPSSSSTLMTALEIATGRSPSKSSPGIDTRGFLGLPSRARHHERLGLGLVVHTQHDGPLRWRQALSDNLGDLDDAATSDVLLGGSLV